jgi:plastocyanin
MRKLTLLLAMTALAVSVFQSATIAGPTSPQGERATVKISNFKFEPKTLTVNAGTTVEWANEGGRHTVEADNGSFKSDVIQAGGKFEFKFDKPGTYAYYCGIHGDKGGKDMAGKIIVKAAKKK